MAQAQKAPGNISASAQTINGVQHTLSIWESEVAMRAYLVSGAHLKAMRQFRSMATGKTVGYMTECPPRWDEVHEIWKSRGVEH